MVMRYMDQDSNFKIIIPKSHCVKKSCHYYGSSFLLKQITVILQKKHCLPPALGLKLS